MITKAQSLDSFIDKSLYEKNKGYYQRKIEFGRKGDFITSPGISKLFSEMIAIWIISFWENLNKPEKINLVELGAGNGELLEVLINTFNKDTRSKEDLDKTISLINKYKVINECYQKAQHYINLASNSLSVFENTKEKEILKNLTTFSLSRNF